MTTQIRLYLEIGAAVVLAIAFSLFVHHERAVGEQKIAASDAKALAAARKQADAETALNLERAAKADAGAISAQKAVDDYRAAHPDTPVRLCYPDSSVPGMPTISAADLKLKGAGTRPAVVPEVPGRSESGPDIAAELDAIVQAAGRLAVVYTDRQQR